MLAMEQKINNSYNCKSIFNNNRNIKELKKII
jgi:hypothetical protein